MKKMYILLLAAFFTAVGTNAQNDPKVKSILDKVSAKLNDSRGVTAGFTYTSKNKAGKVAGNASGSISVKGDRFYIKQGAGEIISDGTKTYNYNGTNEITVTPVEDGDGAFTPQTLLSGFYNSGYNYKLLSSAGAYHTIELTPIDRRKPFNKITLYVDKNKMIVSRAQVLEKSGYTTDVTLKNINTNATIPDATFVFNRAKYKANVEVIE